MQGKNGANRMTPPMKAVKKCPMPKSFCCFATLKQQKTSSNVFVGIQQVVSDVTHNGLVVQRRVRIEVFTIIATIETCEVFLRALQQSRRKFGQALRVFRPDLRQRKRG